MLSRCAAVLALLIAVSAPAQAREELSVAEARQLAYNLIGQQQNQAAREVLLTLLSRQPDDPELLIALSRAQRNLGDYDAARSSGQQAFRHADSKTHKFHAARVTAQALASAGHRTRAQLWLRRASMHAPNAQAAEVIRTEYGYVRARNPLSFSIDTSVRPSNNVNNAPTSNRIEIGNLVGYDPTLQPIAGTEKFFAATLFYRLPPGAHALHQLSIGYAGQRVSLSSEAATIDPNLRASDLSFDRLSLGWSGQFRRNDGATGVFDAALRVFADKHGQDHTQNGQVASTGFNWPIGTNQYARIGVFYENLDRLDSKNLSSQTWGLRGNWAISFDNKDRFSLQLGLSDTDSVSPNIAHAATSMRLAYAFGKPLLSAKIELSADMRWSDFDRPGLSFLDQRKDDALTLTAAATLPKLQVYGFAPVVELRHMRNHSNISTFDTRSTELGFSLRSTY